MITCLMNETPAGFVRTTQGSQLAINRRPFSAASRLREMADALTPDKKSPHFERGTLLFTQQRSLSGTGINEEERSVTATITTETTAAVFDYEQYEVIDEVLVSSGVRFTEHVPLLKNHSRVDVLDVIGSAREHRQEGNEWASRVYFASPFNERDEVGIIWNRVREKHLRAVSIGYWPERYVDLPAGESATIEGRKYTASATRRLRVTLETLVFELSVVPVGADRNALFRGVTDTLTEPRRTSRQIPTNVIQGILR